MFVPMLQQQHAEDPPVGDGGQRDRAARERRRPARADCFGDGGIFGRIQRAVAAEPDRARPDLRDDAGIVEAFADRHEGARLQVEGPCQAPHEREHHFVRPQRHARFTDETVQGAAHLAFARGTARALAVANAGVQAGAELGQVNGGCQRVVGAQSERGHSGVGVGRIDENHDRRRVLPPGIDGRAKLGIVRGGEGHEHRVGVMLTLGRQRFGYDEAGAGEGALQACGSGRGVPREQHAATVRHATRKVECIS